MPLEKLLPMPPSENNTIRPTEIAVSASTVSVNPAPEKACERKQEIKRTGAQQNWKTQAHSGGDDQSEVRTFGNREEGSVREM